MVGIAIFYDSKKHDFNPILDKLVEPYLMTVLGESANLRKAVRHESVTEKVSVFKIESYVTPYKNQIRIKSFAEKKGITLEKLTSEDYFLKSLRRNKK